MPPTSPMASSTAVPAALKVAFDTAGMVPLKTAVITAAPISNSQTTFIAAGPLRGRGTRPVRFGRPAE